MDAIRKMRGGFRTAFTKTANQLEEEIAKDELDLPKIDDLTRRFNERISKLAQADSQYMEEMLKANVAEDVFQTEIDEVEEYCDRMNDLIGAVERVKTKTNQNDEFASLKSGHDSSTQKRGFKLPKIEWKTFGGEAKDWLGFWAQFQKIHEDAAMDDADKFQYLLQAIEKGTKARELIESFPPSASCYPKAIESLKNRYGRDDILVEVYVRELLKLVLKNVLNGNKKIPLSSLYDKLETYLRALETLGVTTEKCAAMLYPLVESCLPIEVMKTWERNRIRVTAENPDAKNPLSVLMIFLRLEVDGDERVAMSQQGFELEKEDRNRRNKNNTKPEPDVPTAFGLFSGNQTQMKNRTCIFCGKANHESVNCYRLDSMPLEEKKKKIGISKACFMCLKTGHISKNCKNPPKCLLCKGKHHAIMCVELPSHRTEKGKHEEKKPEKKEDKDENKSDSVLASQTCVPEVLLQTLMVRLLHGNKEIIIRALLDSAAQRSYITENVAKAIGYESVGEETIQHNLFGGVQSAQKIHKKYQIRLGSLESDYTCTFATLNERKICGTIPRINNGPWMDEIKKMRIPLSDIGNECPEVSLLIGADVAGKLKTGRVVKLKSGLVAEETYLGWTLMGKLPGNNCEVKNSSMMVTTLLLKDSAISDLWKLDAIGIMDPAESKTKEEMEEAAMDHFKKTVTRDEDGRYEISLPWVQGHRQILDNRAMAEKRLMSATKKLESQGLFRTYGEIFKNWENEMIIEEVSFEEHNNFGHYLPHRAVYKENSATMKTRPVFDASAKRENSPSLNECLEPGPNLLELIPSILSRFRLYKVGVISDIAKAFLQIGVRPQDRDYLRFLWWEDYNQKKIKVYRHRRVVFGVTSSPFLLGAVLQYVLQNVPPEVKSTAQKLKESFYVDNCVASFNNEEETNKFKNEAIQILSEAKFNLRDWISNSRAFLKENKENPDNKVPVLGLLWDLKDDTLSCDVSKLAEYQTGIVTKRKILSAAHRGYDPIGFTVPVMLYPKLLLQDCWDMKVGWDEELPQEMSTKFTTWINQLPVLENLKIPRWFGGGSENEHWSLHTFGDASGKAYAACVFLRIEKPTGEVIVQLVQARARVAPKKINRKVTITRLELLSCLIGARLAQSVKNYLMLDDIDCHYWTDSMDCLYYIKNDESWATFVWNRVQEIRSLTNTELWKHVPGIMNPADLPSRGCSAKQLIDSSWWEGPVWLRKSEEFWPKSVLSYNEENINSERKKTVVSNVTVNRKPGSTNWMMKYSNNYLKILRLVSYMLRFVNNIKCSAANRKRGELSVSELEAAENRIVKLIQIESFKINDENLRALQVFEDDGGLMRVKSKIVMRNDIDAFKTPVVLPSDHELVLILIQNKHEEYSHAGVQTMMSVLREKFWLIKARRTIRKVITRCGVCKREKSQPFQTIPAPLPEGRINDAAVFQVTGVDLAGPLYLKGQIKCYIVLFTCAVYRAVHLELITALSTEAFLLALRRFIARRGRPSTIYSDNGTNFVGASNALDKLDWKKIATEATAKKIQWIFNPPSAAWWGGFWERLVGLVKKLLRRVLGRACLQYEELATILCDCENVVNSRPLTYISEDINDLTPLTPLMFLQDVKESGVPDLDQIDATGVNKGYRHLQSLRETLRNRFRLEYLGQLVHRAKSKKTRAIKKNEIVYIGSDNVKRMHWPLGRVLELFPGRDKEVRVARVRTATGELLRPVQRLFPLEVQYEESETVLLPKVTITRSGRKVKPPERYQA